MKHVGDVMTMFVYSYAMPLSVASQQRRSSITKTPTWHTRVELVLNDLLASNSINLDIDDLLMELTYQLHEGTLDERFKDELDAMVNDIISVRIKLAHAKAEHQLVMMKLVCYTMKLKMEKEA